MKKLLLILLAVLFLTACTAPPVPTEPVAPTQESTGTGLGQKIQDFAVTTVEGEDMILSDIIANKKLVVLNFWYADCPWCVKEFPSLELAYQRYREDVEVLALNPYDGKDAAAVFADEHGLTFPVASCLRDFPQYFGITGYPTSVFIDREGRISLIHPGAITDPAIFYKVFETYTAEDYTHATYYRLEELLK